MPAPRGSVGDGAGHRGGLGALGGLTGPVTTLRAIEPGALPIAPRPPERSHPKQLNGGGDVDALNPRGPGQRRPKEATLGPVPVLGGTVPASTSGHGAVDQKVGATRPVPETGATDFACLVPIAR